MVPRQAFGPTPETQAHGPGRRVGEQPERLTFQIWPFGKFGDAAIDIQRAGPSVEAPTVAALGPEQQRQLMA